MKKNPFFEILFAPIFSIFPWIPGRLKSHLEAREYEKLLKFLVHKGVKINAVFDIGAHKGRWTKWNKKILTNGWCHRASVK